MTHLLKFRLVSEINGVPNTSRTIDNIILIKNASRVIIFKHMTTDKKIE